MEQFQRTPRLKNVVYDEGYVTIDFSKNILGVKESKENSMLESIVYSIFDLKNIKGIIIQVEGEVF